MTGAEKLRRLERALQFGGNLHAVEDVVQQIREGRARLFEHGDGSIVAEIIQWPRAKTLNYWLLSGRLADVLALDAEVSAWGIAEGCELATATGRKGWGRAGAPYGWKPHGYTFCKRLAS